MIIAESTARVHTHTHTHTHKTFLQNVRIQFNRKKQANEISFISYIYKEE